MSMCAPDELVRACFAAYETKDRAALENLLSDDFTFSSPLDDHISRECYFERCWPNSQHLSSFEIKNLQVEGSHVWVRYVGPPYTSHLKQKVCNSVVYWSRSSPIELYDLTKQMATRLPRMLDARWQT